MITNISINNYALIDSTEIELERGFSIITGETGAGKSILLGAIGLTLGERSEVAALRDKQRKCIIEVTYNVVGYALQAWFERHDLDYDDTVVVRREVLPDGKSRAFVNDTPVSNKLLKELGSFLIDIHSQHQSLLIGKPEYQLELLDAYSGNGDLVVRYRECYKAWQTLRAELVELQQQADAATREEDYLTFQFNQLEVARLRAGEQRELEEELAVLSHAEHIKEAFSALAYAVNGVEEPMVSVLKVLKGRMASLSGVLPEAAEYESRLQSVILELEDLADEAERRAERVEYLPARVEEINGRLNVIYELLHKHRVEDESALLQLQAEIGRKLQGIQSFADRIADLTGSIAAAEAKLAALANELHVSREAHRPLLEQDMKALLMGLGIKHAAFSVELVPLERFAVSGKEDVQFLFAANKNQQPGELSKVASGGEISRLMLSLKYILSRDKQLPVIIFDEIDTGVSGEIAHKMAVMMAEMSKRMQVISISHLPQIAAAGVSHFKVYKEDEQQETVSRIRRLSAEERVAEIAGMISGSVITKAALANARQLLQQE